MKKSRFTETQKVKVLNEVKTGLWVKKFTKITGSEASLTAAGKARTAVWKAQL